MARIRTVKPEMAQDEDLAECSIEAQLLAVRILNHCDDEGLFKANPLLVKSNCFPLLPFDSEKILGMIQELSSAGYLRVGEGEDGKTYGEVVNFLKHQRVDKPQPSKIKGLVTFQESSKNDLGTLPVGKEGNGKEGNGETPTSESKIPPCPHEEIIAAWHEIMPDKPGITVSLWPDSASAAHLASRWRQSPNHQTVDWWRELFLACREHDFWMNKWDGFNFRWLVKKQNFIKAVEHWETTYRRQHEG